MSEDIKLAERAKDALERRNKASADASAASEQFAAAVKLAIDHGNWSLRKLGGFLGLSAARVHQIYKSS
jgi:DNA-binding transcriptional regulator WhiA